jgi:hypothetical protein
MKVFVLHPITSTFLAGDKSWKIHAEKAVNFENAREAIGYCERQIFDVSEVILQTGEFPRPAHSRVKLRAETGTNNISPIAGGQTGQASSPAVFADRRLAAFELE